MSFSLKTLNYPDNHRESIWNVFFECKIVARSEPRCQSMTLEAIANALFKSRLRIEISRLETNTTHNTQPRHLINSVQSRSTMPSPSLSKTHFLRRLHKKSQARSLRIYSKLLIKSVDLFLATGIFVNTLPILRALLLSGRNKVLEVSKRRYFRHAMGARGPQKDAGEREKIDQKLARLEVEGSDGSKKEFRRLVRMDPKAFHALVGVLKKDKEFFQAQNSGRAHGRNATSVEGRLAVALYYLGMHGKGASLDAVASFTGYSKGSCKNFVQDVIRGCPKLKAKFAGWEQ